MQNIIVLDDEQEIADLLEVYLVNEGYQVFKFYRAEGVLDCIQENEISLAILDVMLPDIDGFQLCRQIRENWYFPIIMLTAKVEDVDKITGLTVGADDYITKPFNPLEVVARVKGQLRRSQTYNPSMTGQEDEETYNIRGLELTPNIFTERRSICLRLNTTYWFIFAAIWGKWYRQRSFLRLSGGRSILTVITR